MLLVFDTSVLIALEREDKFLIKKLSDLSKVYTSPPQTTFIAYYEFVLGVKNRSPKNKSRAFEFLKNFSCLEAGIKTAEILADLKAKYDSKGISISLADLIIASQVRENNMILITKDKIFEKIEEIDKIILD